VTRRRSPFGGPDRLAAIPAPTELSLFLPHAVSSIRQLVRDELAVLRRLAADRRDASSRMPSVRRTGLPEQREPRSRAGSAVREAA